MLAFLSFSLVLLPFVFAATIDIQVGDGAKLLYSPEAVFASPGDHVVFHFHPKNHTVTQSSFANPCGRKDGGFNSGFHPVPANQTENLPTYTVTVNDTQPIWVYCAQNLRLPSSHCGAGMVFAINCGPDGSNNSFTNFKQAALAYGAGLSASPNSYTTAAYGGYTIPVAPTPTPVTTVISLGAQVWTTTYASYPNSPDPTPVSPEGQVHKVVVGSGSLAFNPPRVSARPRDTVIFEFHPKNHTVTQSTFDDPCRPFNVNSTTGFDSGFIPVAADAKDFPTWNYTVKDTAPVWAYCKQGNHCGQGMVFTINSDESSGRSFQSFQNVAKALNGTALAASPAPSSNVYGSSARIEVGSARWILFVAGLLGAML